MLALDLAGERLRLALRCAPCRPECGSGPRAWLLPARSLRQAQRPPPVLTSVLRDQRAGARGGRGPARRPEAAAPARSMPWCSGAAGGGAARAASMARTCRRTVPQRHCRGSSRCSTARAPGSLPTLVGRRRAPALVGGRRARGGARCLRHSRGDGAAAVRRDRPPGRPPCAGAARRRGRLAETALQPQRAGEIGDGLRRLLLLTVGDAAIEQRLGHDRGWQIAAAQHRGQRLRRLAALPASSSFAAASMACCASRRVLLAFLGLGAGASSSCCSAGSSCLAALAFGLRLGRGLGRCLRLARSRRTPPHGCCGHAASASLRQSRAMMSFPRDVAIERAQHLLPGETTPILCARSKSAVSGCCPSIPQSPTWRGCAAGPRPCP